MVDSNRFRAVAENVAYRFEDRRYSISDEYGDHAYTSHTVALLVFPLIKYTPCGMWIANFWTEYPQQPMPWREDVDYCLPGKRFVNLQANKRFALPTIPLALESYRARKNREIHIYEARIKGAKSHIEAADHLYNYKVPASLKAPVKVS